MRRLFRRPKSEAGQHTKVQVFSAEELRFVGEQDGVPERQLKAQWQPMLEAHREIARAYLAHISYEHSPEHNVVLCIRSANGADRALVEQLAAPFRTAFGSDAHLDFAFVSEEQEADLIKVCAPFYVAA